MTEKPCVLRVCCFANGAPCPIEGQYLQTFDFEAYGGVGYGTFTEDISEARVFASQGDALAFWNTQSKTVPFRADGKPNKPLTSTTMEILPLLAAVEV